jgi:hypothetical protein
VLTLRVEIPGDAATAIPILLSRLERVGVEGQRVATVVAMPGGSRVEMTGTFVPSTAPRPRGPADPVPADVSVLLARLTDTTDVELKRLDTGDVERSGSVRLRGSGGLEEISRLIAGLEDDLSAPPRIRALRLDRATERGSEDRGYQLDITFLIRDDVIARVGGGDQR